MIELISGEKICNDYVRKMVATRNSVEIDVSLKDMLISIAVIVMKKN